MRRKCSSSHPLESAITSGLKKLKSGVTSMSSPLGSCTEKIKPTILKKTLTSRSSIQRDSLGCSIKTLGVGETGTFYVLMSPPSSKTLKQSASNLCENILSILHDDGYSQEPLSLTVSAIYLGKSMYLIWDTHWGDTSLILETSTSTQRDGTSITTFQITEPLTPLLTVSIPLS